MNKIELERRTKRFALDIIRFVGTLPRNSDASILGRQLLRSGTSIGANYREANRAESRADFIHKLGLVEKEAAETEYWLELLKEAVLADGEAASSLLSEANQLVRLFNRANRSAKISKVEQLSNRAIEQ
jgi:four helix bundle protein